MNAPQAIRLNDILDAVLAYHPKADLDVIKKAYVYSAKVHAGQVRKTGEPYLMHPLAVANILAHLKLDEASVVAGLLHDTVEDTLATIEEVEELFGKDVASIVDGVTKLGQVKFNTAEEKLAENFRKMLVAMSRDIRVLLVKLADRLHNMRTLEHMKPEKQEAIARETMDIYAPLANRLGISWLKIELEDLAFRYTNTREYEELADKLGKTRKDREKFIDEVTREIAEVLKKAGIQGYEVTGRPKHLWSIHKKMATKNMPFEEVYDLIAFRVIVDSVGQCYETLGHIHGLWRPIPGRFKDYIAMPKPNGYKSLHTTVIGPKAERIEIQIRTRDMHEVAEEGIAAHWVYKEKGSVEAKESDRSGFGWLRQLMDWQRDLKDPSEFLDSVKFDLFSDEVFIFTPQGHVIELPRGSSPVDFAFAIHSDVGMRCAGAKVNGRIVPLRYTLRNGDTCEIITNKSQRPNKDWLEFTRTSRAKTKIRTHLRTAERDRALSIGRELMEREFKRYQESAAKYLKPELLDQFATEKYRTLDELLIAVGYGKLGAPLVVERALPDEVRTRPPEAAPKKSRLSELIDRVARRNASGVKIEGIEDMLVHYARCCSPVKGDNIVGFVTRGRGLTVHRKDCTKVLELDPERRIHVSWDSSSSFSRSISLRVVTDDREGMLADLSGVFSKNSINISEANCKVLADGQAVNTFKCGISDIEQLRRIVKALEAVKGVHGVERARSQDG
ncbi:MAG: bifunctional (p)ppGpp synthetase/guanosine-3',5'-bis(diphosphate) 3'-pyrophosphohydrolase [Deltaproteobacteria bacterium]|nr:bifunctional (p)ppGpp synthetase/guanosine-3',5'-bis(diphosphate) 3'-pyrophosphohydrolase [Deltaproteobacteria bacterium]